MSGEDGGDVNSALLTQRESNTSEPLMELGNDCALLFVVDVLIKCQQELQEEHKVE